jgi:FkbM family methyltransferase
MDKNGEIVDGKGTYQIKKIRVAMEHVKWFHDHHVAIDVGAHVGLWAMQLAKRFRVVRAFEPVASYRECLAINAPEAVVYPFALGARSGRVAMHVPKLNGGLDTGGTHVGGDGECNVDLKTLDSFDFQNVDFLKIDVEGFEDQVIAGARETILRARPVVIVEQKPHKLGPNFGIHGTPAVDSLRALGYIVAREMSGDFIMIHAG